MDIRYSKLLYRLLQKVLKGIHKQKILLIELTKCTNVPFLALPLKCWQFYKQKMKSHSISKARGNDKLSCVVCGGSFQHTPHKYVCVCLLYSHTNRKSHKTILPFIHYIQSIQVLCMRTFCLSFLNLCCPTLTLVVKLSSKKLPFFKIRFSTKKSAFVKDFQNTFFRH